LLALLPPPIVVVLGMIAGWADSRAMSCDNVLYGVFFAALAVGSVVHLVSSIILCTKSRKVRMSCLFSTGVFVLLMTASRLVVNVLGHPKGIGLIEIPAFALALCAMGLGIVGLAVFLMWYGWLGFFSGIMIGLVQRKLHVRPTIAYAVIPLVLAALLVAINLSTARLIGFY
jgi:hypothetical protein